MTQDTTVQQGRLPIVTLFAIRGLHGLRDFTIPIENNRLVLVGENGVGKSTVVSVLYYLLTQQWHRLARYPFADLSITINGSHLSLTHADLDSFLVDRRRDTSRHHRYAPRLREEASRELSQLDLFSDLSDIDIHRVATRFAARVGVSVPLAEAVLRDVAGPSPEPTSRIAGLARELSEVFQVPVLFLPTYRRIERDLTEIFPHLVEDFEQSFKRRKEQLRARGRSHVELVEFGMDDVNSLVAQTMVDLKEALRQSLNRLTGEYLREVLRKDYKNATPQALRDLPETTVASVLDRIDETILPNADKQRFPELIAQIGASTSLNADDQVVAHFFTKMLRLLNSQTTRENPVREFVSVCNNYLTGKQLYFDNKAFTLKISALPGQKPIATPESHELELSALSSGEKQIVSLFAHLYLSSGSPHFVIIDEPELSLSVPWQEQFLPDMVRSGFCSGLIAVTHSPFIYQNELESHTHSLAEFTTPSQ